MEKKFYKVVATAFSSKMTYYDWDKDHSYPHFNVAHRMEFLLALDSLEECEIWILENLGRDYCMGYGISRFYVNGESGAPEFKIDAVKDYYFECGYIDEYSVYTTKCKLLGCKEKEVF